MFVFVFGHVFTLHFFQRVAVILQDLLFLNTVTKVASVFAKLRLVDVDVTIAYLVITTLDQRAV